MYNSFFGIRACPFGSSPDPRFLYVMPQIRETLACLEYGITARKGFVVMTGEVGTGKTTLLKAVLSRFEPHHVSTAFVFNPRLDVLDFLEFVLNDFGITPSAKTKSAMLIQLNRWLLERFCNNGVCVVAIDEAQNLSWELLEEIRLLTNLETSSEKLLQIVLSGQPELENKLCHASIRQLRQRVWMWCKTRSLTADETEAYIAQRLHAAGATEPILTDEALWLVHRFSKGIPRVINLICEHALINAYAEQIKPIPARIIEAIGDEFVLDQRPLVISSTAISNSPDAAELRCAQNFMKTVPEKELDV